MTCLAERRWVCLHTEHLYDMLSREGGGGCLHMEHLYDMLSRGEVGVSSYGALV